MLPNKLKGEGIRIYDSCAAIVDGVTGLVNACQFERMKARTLHQATLPAPIIGASKLGMGNAARQYAIDAFDCCGANALTQACFPGFRLNRTLSQIPR